MGNGVIRVGQKFHAGLQAPGREITDRRLSDAAGKGMGQVIFVDMGKLRKCIQGNILGIIAVYVSFGKGALLGNPEGGIGNDG